MRVVIFLSLIVFAGIGCKKNQTFRFFKQHEEVDFPEPRNAPTEVSISSHSPVFFELSDRTCSEANALKTLGKVNLHTSINGRSQKIDIDLPKTSGYGLRNEIILSIDYGYHIQEIFSECTQRSASSFICQKSIIKHVSDGKPVSICQNNIYPRDSIENVALNAAYGVWKVFQETSMASNQLKNLPKVRILVHPKVESIVNYNNQVFSGFKTDNAFWSFRDGESYPYFIGLLPHSSNYLKALSEYRFFEQFAVIGHEFGHHIFYHIGSHFFSNFNHLKIRKHEVRQDPAAKFESVLSADDKSISQRKKQRDVNHSTVVASINEMFADYIAYYSFENDKTTGKLFIGSNSASRDIGSKIHADGQEKILSFSVLKHFFSPYYSSPDNRLSANHQDTHIVGAIIGHGMSEYLGTVAKPNSDRKTMISLGMSWISNANAVAQKKGIYDKTIYFLEDLLEEGAKLGVNHNNLSPESCKILEKKFPVFYPYWRIKKAFSC